MFKQDIETREALVTIYTTRKEGVYKALISTYNKDYSVNKPKFSQEFKSDKHGEALAQAMATRFNLTNAYTLNDFREVV